MMSRLILTFLFAILISVPAELRAQFDSDEILRESQIFSKFGSIPSSDFEIEPDHSESHEYLLREVSIEFDETDRGIVVYMHYLNRIKVYTDDPIEQTDIGLVGIPYYASENIERVTNLQASTHKPGGQFYRISGDDTRNAQLNSRYRLVEFEFPEVKEGDILEYKYTIERRYIDELPDVYLSDRVPIRKLNVYLKNPNYLRYNVLEENTGFEVNYEEFFVDTSSVPLVFTYERPDPVNIEKWSAEDVPAMDEDSYISSIDDIRAKLKFQISEFGVPRQPLENSWELVAAQIRRNSNPFDVIEDHSRLIENLSDQFSGIEDQVALQDSVFQLLNSNVRFNGVHAIFAEDGLENVIEGEESNQAEINTLLLGLLSNQGIEAYPMFISSRDFGQINPSFPSLFQFNRMLVVSEIDGNRTIMDASYSHSLPGLIPVDSYNMNGFVIRGREFEWVPINPEKSTFRLNVEIKGVLDENGSLKAEMNAETSGYPSREIRRGMEGVQSTREIVRDVFLEVYSEAEIENTEVLIDNSNRDLIEVRAVFEIPNYARSFTDGLEYKPMLVGYLYQNPFESTSRRVPITLDAPETLNVTYDIELPPGYFAESVQSQQVTELEGARLSEKYEIVRDRLIYSFGVEISRKQFSPDEYVQLQSIYERWVELSNETWFIEIDR